VFRCAAGFPSVGSRRCAGRFKEKAMRDVLYVVLTVTVFAVLAAVVAGLEQL
jgi:hypothetical protein